MEIRYQNQLTLLLNRIIFIFCFTLSVACNLHAQCLSSVNPVGGTESLLLMEKNTLRFISFYKHGGGHQYFSGDEHAEFNLIDRSKYNYIATNMGCGITRKITIETEMGYYLDKTQFYNVVPGYSLKGHGFSNLVLLGKVNLYTNHVKRKYLSLAAGPKIPFSREMKQDDNVELPIDLQPSAGSFGWVVSTSFVKESPAYGIRFFLTNRSEINGTNKKGYQPGNIFFTSFYFSKHLMFPWLKGDWTSILQIRNETRMQDRLNGNIKSSSGGTIFYLVPQVNYFAFEKWNLSAMVDIPLYQYFKGTQMGAGHSFTFVLARTFKF